MLQIRNLFDCSIIYQLAKVLRLENEIIKKKKISSYLFINQCPAHPADYDFPNLKMFFFPANCTSEL